ncbi:hypothetical protein JHK87_018247 [Glycine soja]|nr:hypothetical protein JHK87_018247 [Glycine soja]
MGNKIARTTQVSASEYYLHELPSTYNLVLKEVLGRGRFFKSIQCKHDEGLVLVKVYFKRGDFLDLSDYERRLSQIKHIFTSIDHPHVWPFQFWQETDKAAYLLRQYFFHNLHDRLSTRPFLSLIEKKWLAFQLLVAVKQCHENGVCHGDIKCENVLITSTNWVYLADFASFKPTYIPYDDPSDFSFFFDTGGRRLCYLAPERFYEHGGEMQVAQDTPLKPYMDIFAVGCVIAELFLEGQPLFELSQLLAYRRGQYDPSQHLEKIPDLGIRKMILHMIQLEPEFRLSAERYLKEYAAVVFPIYFSPFLHDFYRCWSPLHSDMRVLLCQSAFPEILKQMMNNKSSDDAGVNSAELLEEMVAKESDINSLLRDAKKNKNPSHVAENAHNSTFPENLKNLQTGKLLQTISNAFRGNDHPFLKSITMNDLNSLMSEYDSQSDTFGMPFLPLPKDSMRCEGMVLITSLLCSCIRNVKLPHLRRAAVLLLKASALYIDDEDRLQRVIPYVIVMLSDSAAIVRCAALETLCDILPLVRDFPPSDAKIFPEYILPMLSMLPDDPEESVRICYASNIAKLALTAYGFLIRSISLSEAGVLDELSLPQKPLTSSTQTSGRMKRINGDAQLLQLRKSIAEVVQELVMGPKQTPNIRRALLQDIGKLCCFFGVRQSNDSLLPILPAFLNDRDEQLRTVFYEKIVYVCFFVGQRSVEEYLLPYIEQALSDVTEAVIVKAVECMTILCKSGFFRKRILLQMIERAFPLLCYPSEWVRRSVVSFIAASSENLGAVDSYVFLAPVIRPFLRTQPVSLASEKALLSCLKPPVSRQVFYEVLENSRSSDMLERQRKIWYSSSQSKLWEMDLLKKGIDELDSLKNWTDKQQGPGVQQTVGTAFQQPGITDCDKAEAKLRDMGAFMHNDSNTVGHRDTQCSEKLQFSGFMSPHFSGMNSLTYEKPSEGIPLYSFSVDRRGMGIPSAASDPPLPMNSLGVSSSAMPWVNPLSKSFNLANSVPAPKLFSGSYSISNGSKQFHRVVHEPDARENETAYVNNTFQDVGLSANIKGTSIALEDATAQTDLSGFPSFARASIPDSGWRPRGVLVAHLQEHRSAVNDIAISADHSFFVSASDDSTVKIWDSRKLEKDISFRSKLTYHMEGSRVLCATMLPGSAQVIIGASDGFIHMFSVDHISRGLGNVVEKYSGIADITKKDIKEGAILNLLNCPVDNYTIIMLAATRTKCIVGLLYLRRNGNRNPDRSYCPEAGDSIVLTHQVGNYCVYLTSRFRISLMINIVCAPISTWKVSSAHLRRKLCRCYLLVSRSIYYTAKTVKFMLVKCIVDALFLAVNKVSHKLQRRMIGFGSSFNVVDLTPFVVGDDSEDLKANANALLRILILCYFTPKLIGITNHSPLEGLHVKGAGADKTIVKWEHHIPKHNSCSCTRSRLLDVNGAVPLTFLHHKHPSAIRTSLCMGQVYVLCYEPSNKKN